MGALLRREALMLARRPASSAALAVHAGLLVAFLWLWEGGRGVTLFGARTAFDRLRLVECALLGALLPWLAARALADERRNDLVRLALLAGRRPPGVVAAKLAATFLALALVVLSGLPLLLLAQQMSALPLGRVLAAEALLLGFAALVPSLAFASMGACREAIFGWVGATVAAAAMLATVRSFAGSDVAAGGMLAILGAVTAAAVAATTRPYLAEHDA
jgi:hypothetical protein